MRLTCRVLARWVVPLTLSLWRSTASAQGSEPRGSNTSQTVRGTPDPSSSAEPRPRPAPSALPGKPPGIDPSAPPPTPDSSGAKGPEAEASNAQNPPEQETEPVSQELTPPQLLVYVPAATPKGMTLSVATPVDLELSIATDGRVAAVSSVGDPDELLARAARRAAAQFVFKPALRGAKPVAVVIQYRFWFAPRSIPPARAPAEQEPDAPPETPPPKKALPAGTEGEPAPKLNESDEIFEGVGEVAAPPRETTRRTLDRTRLSRVPGTRGDAIRAIEVLPGVARAPAGSNPILRGAGQSESVVLLDGTHVPSLYHFGGVTSFVHPKLVQQVDLYPGNFSARYGRATGGVIEAKLRAPKNQFGAILDLNLVDSSVLVEGPITDEITFAGAFRRSNIDFIFESFVPDGTFNVLVAPVYWDYQGVVQYDYGRESFLRFAAFGSRDELTLLFDEPQAEDATLRGRVGAGIEFHRLQTLHQTQLGQVRQRLQFTLGLQQLRQNVGPNSRAYFDIYEYDARGEWSAFVVHGAQVIAGLDVVQQRLDGAYTGSVASSDEGAPDIPDAARGRVTVDPTTIPIFNPAVYLEARLYPSPGLLLVPGLRFDYFGQIGQATLNPRLSQRYVLSDWTTLKSGVGWYSQPPIYYEAIEPIGNPQLEPYHALHTSLGVEQQLGASLRLDVEGFYKRLYNRVVDTQGGLPPRFVNDGRGRIVGLETGATFEPNRQTYGQLSYTLSRSERQDREDAWRLFDQDQTHVLSLAAGYRPGAGWEFGARFRYVTGNPTTPIVDAAYDAGSGVYYPVFGAQNSKRDPAFQQLDLRVQKRFRIGSGSLSVYADVQNVYNAKNLEGYTYSYDYQTRQAAQSSPFFPNLGLRGEL